MVTFKPVVFHQTKPKNGSYNVKIRVTYKGVSRFLPTTLFCTQADLTRQGKIKPGNILAKGNELCDRMRNTLADVSPFKLEGRDVDWVVQHIRSSFSVERFSLDFFEWCAEAIQTKREPTRRIYELAVNSFRKFVGEKIDINDITSTLLREFIDWVNNSTKYVSCGRGSRDAKPSKVKNSAGCGERKCNYLSTLYRMAQDRYNDEDTGKILIPKHPFNRIGRKLPPTYMSQHSIGLDLIQMLIDLEPEGERESVARDAFLISFLLMGANVADLYKAPQPFNGVWEYNRAKTKDRRSDNARMRVYVPSEIVPYEERHRDPSGKYWFDFHLRYASTQSFTTSINEGLKTICERIGVAKFTMYAARKTWATIARQQGIDKGTIDECLCHIGGFKMADVYIERSWDVINSANRVVISQLRW